MEATPTLLLLFLLLVSSSSPTTSDGSSSSSPNAGRGPLNAVADFGAVPDGKIVDNATGQMGGTDNSVQLQKAINAAQQQGRSLFLPEGRYMVNSTLLVGCATPGAVGGGGRSSCDTSQTASLSNTVHGCIFLYS
jgi:hypothetical protein